MLELDVWLFVAAIIALCMQGAKITSFKQPLSTYILAGLIVGTCVLSAELIASQSLVRWQQLANEQLQALQILLLLELSLACFAGMKLLPINLCCALAYGLLWFFQQGAVDTSFLVQAFIYSSLVLTIMLLSYWLTQLEKQWPMLLFSSMLISIVIMSATLPTNSNVPAINWHEMAFSLGAIALLIFTGVIFHQVKRQLFINKNNV